MDSDIFLIGRMRLGDDDAIEEFVRKYYSVILRYCTVKLGSQTDGEDAVQETFERFFRSFDQYRHYGKALNYLYVIARNVCKDQLRNSGDVLLTELPERSDTPIEQAERRMMLYQAFLRLPLEMRETAVLYFIQGLKQREIARILGIGVPLVKYRIKRVRQMLISSLGQEVWNE